MLSYDASVVSNGFCEPPPEPWTSPSAAPRRARRPRVRRLVPNTALATRFLSWEGRPANLRLHGLRRVRVSGVLRRRAARAARDGGGRRRVLAALDTGAVPGTCAGPRRSASFHSSPRAAEFHVHLLARSPRRSRRALDGPRGRTRRLPAETRSRLEFARRTARRLSTPSTSAPVSPLRRPDPLLVADGLSVVRRAPSEIRRCGLLALRHDPEADRPRPGEQGEEPVPVPAPDHPLKRGQVLVEPARASPAPRPCCAGTRRATSSDRTPRCG